MSRHKTDKSTQTDLCANIVAIETMERSIPSSPGIQESHDDRMQQQPTPPTAFPFAPTPIGPAGGQPGYPMQAHVLVDPVTGQHYIVPQAYYPPMQPMYYPPPPAQQHMYYGYPQQQQQQHKGTGNGAAAGGPPPPPPTHQQGPQQMYMGMPMYSNMMAGRNEPPPQQPQHINMEKKQTIEVAPEENSEDAMSTTSNISRNSFNLAQNSTKIAQFGAHRENSREQMYSGELRSPMATRQKYENPFNKLHRLESDPSRGGTQSDFEGRSQMMRVVERPQMSSASDVESNRRFSRNLQQQMESEMEREEEQVVVEPQRRVLATPAAKSVRMEINFDDVPMMETEKKPTRRSTATAFTVNLGDEKEVSLQEAARTLAENRRKVKIPKNPSLDHSTPLPSSKTNKNYLLEKLLTGKNSNDVDYDDDGGSSEVGGGARSDFDARSEALTFVIDTSKRNSGGGMYGQVQQQTKIVQYSDDDDDSSSDSEIMQQYSARSAPAPAAPPPPKETPRPTALPSPRAPIRVAPTSSATTTPRSPAATTRFDRSGGSANSDFLQELTKLRLMAGLPANGVTGDDSETRRQPFRRSEVASSARAPTVSSQQKAMPSRASFNSKTREPPTPTTNSTPISGRRSEARRSLTGTGNSSPQLSNMARPPFRTGAPRGIMIGQSEQQREQEMTAWLRRKDYNPMKAAALTKKVVPERASREQQFTSRRSMTFHDSPATPTKNISGVGRPVRNRSQEPRNSPKLTGLAKAVDMLSKKCKRSIELIRIQNKGCLSVSVEDLLSAAAEEPRPNESLDEQMDRLSDAFDAVQRYLEQYSLDGYNSPTPVEYFEDEAGDARSTFSGVSTHQENRATESISSSYRKKVLDSS